jgi:predicted nucleic acid-binding protein
VSIFVVDASVGAKWWFPEAHREAALRLRSPAHDLHAPGLFDLEVCSVVCKRIRRGEISARDGERVADLLEQVPVRRHGDRELLRPALALAHTTRQTLYDCLYLALALILEARMVTADERVYRATRSAGTAEHVVWVGDVP